MSYEWAWPEELSIHASITWSRPYTYDLLNDGQVPQVDTAYLYSLILLDTRSSKTSSAAAS